MAGTTEPEPAGHAWQHEKMVGVTWVDWTLFVLTLYPSAFLLQFTNTPIAKMIHTPAPRRAAMAVLLVLEVAVIAYLVWRFALR